MSSKPSPGARIAAALRRFPIYVDPSYASALPAADRRRLAARLKKMPVPTYIVLVPLVQGGTWNDDKQLATVVHSRLGRDGIFVTFHDSADELMGHEWGGDHAADNAAWAVNWDDSLKGASLAARLTRYTDLIISGTAMKVYKQESDAIERDYQAHLKSSAPKPGKRDDGGLALPLAAGGAGVAVAAVAGVLLWRRRRVTAVRRETGDGLLLPRTVFATAGKASEDQLREQASHEVIAFGELLDGSDAPAGERAGTLMAKALDAYQAATKTLDGARGVPDLAGVLVLLDQGRDALASARALADGKPELPPSPLCFFNPLHGDGPAEIDWRPLGSRRRLHVHACRTCARAARDRETPDMLMDRRDGRDVPYFEADPARSVWAETGYGQLRDDLIPRILRGDLNHK
ncbi:hypothetical protein [Actinomadura verrucosospora]|uniref:Uncharacterized protein n=1 Tax=Actinomadura verrucosospora TaxID=46165 RepID=A0A7D3VSB7_ACTVE|nr:hypothetical protein [Actinomadura verrucosospora]QKG19614.1 hypothetical protein ACTIVE_1250 [Actinomadura verrucosospora]